MELAKGNIRERMSDILGLTKGECINIVNFSDQIYELEEETKSIEKIIDILTDYRNRGNMSEAEKEKSLEEYKKLLNNKLYCALIEKSPEYREYLRENIEKKGKPLDKPIVYLENISEKNRLDIRRLTSESLEIVYRKYFKDSIKYGKPSYEEMKTYDKLYKLLSNVMKMDMIYDENEIYKDTDVADYVSTEYNRLFREFTINSLQKEKEDFRKSLKRETAYSTSRKNIIRRSRIWKI